MQKKELFSIVFSTEQLKAFDNISKAATAHVESSGGFRERGYSITLDQHIEHLGNGGSRDPKLTRVENLKERERRKPIFRQRFGGKDLH